MKKNILLYLVAFSTFGGIKTHAQSNYASKAQQFANEVYQDCMEYAKTEYIPILEENLSRVTVKIQPSESNEDYPLLSTVTLKNKCNLSLTRDGENFDPQTFNPLKYQFDFYEDTSQTFKVDNSNYIIIINSKM